MSNIRHLLVATDGSPDSLKAAKLAGDLARGFGARVTVLMVQSEDVVVPHAWGAGDFPADMPSGLMPVEEIRAMLEQRAREEELRNTAAAIGELPSTPELVHRWGHVAAEICGFAAGHEVDMIVLGSHGRSGLKRVLLGSVSRAVANDARCPVIISR